MQKIVTVLAVTSLVAGCSVLESKKIDYKSAKTVSTLEAPPDLILPSGDNRYAVPDMSPKGSASYSVYNRERGAQAAGQGSELLPAVDKVRIERAGSQRWLVVNMPPQQVWPVVKDFWQELGFVVNVEMPDAGVMETDWAENRAKVPQDFLRNFLGKAMDAVYSTAERDKFRTRLETATGTTGTEIYISHRGMFEVFEGTQGGGDQGTGRTVWQPRPADPELEAEMLRRLMVRFGVEEARAKTMLAEKAEEPRASLVKTAGGVSQLSLPESFDRAWRRVGLALDRIGFAVEDRDRAAGTYFVRYVDPDAANAKSKGFLSKLAFWKDSDAKALAQRYRVRLSGEGDSTQVVVQQEDGSPARSETGNRIVNLLHEQLK